MNITTMENDIESSATANHATMRCGYYNLSSGKSGSSGSIGQHTYGEADKKINFNCYGGNHQTGGKGEVYPAKFASIKEWKGKKISVDLQRARYYASNGQAGWENRTNYDRKPMEAGTKYGDCSGLIYAIGGVCHQMANSIFVAQTNDASSLLVWPPSFYATWAVYGVRGNHTTYKKLPRRLSQLIKTYPRIVPEEVDKMSVDVRDMLTQNMTSQAWHAEMMDDARTLFGADFAKDGKQDEFINLVRRVRNSKNEMVVQLLSSNQDPANLAERLNRLGADFGSEAANLVKEEIAEDFGNITGLSVDPERMLHPDTLRSMGQTLGL